MKSTIEITVTPERLYALAECSKRMTDYADPNESLLITTMRSQSGEVIRLTLDQKCLNQSAYKKEVMLCDSS